MTAQPAPAAAENDRLLRLEVEAAIRSLTLVEGCPVGNLRRALEELDGDGRWHDRDFGFAPHHPDSV